MGSPSTDSTAIVEGCDDFESPVPLFDHNRNAKEQLQAVEVQNRTADSVSKDRKIPPAARLPPEVLEQ